MVQKMKSLALKIIIHACQLIHRDLNKASDGQNVNSHDSSCDASYIILCALCLRHSHFLTFALFLCGNHVRQALKILQSITFLSRRSFLGKLFLNARRMLQYSHTQTHTHTHTHTK
jgi:hypothetical protein